MAINAKCRRCGDELFEAGAILLSPPDMLEGEIVWYKHHLCVFCFAIVIGAIDIAYKSKKEE